MKKMGRKTILKRIKITKKGKFLRRISHIGHNLAKKSGKQKQRKKKMAGFKILRKKIRKHIF